MLLEIKKYSSFFRILFLLFSLSSCGGYRIRQRGNPFKDIGIKSVAVPLFINKSLYPAAHTFFTREVKKLLESYPDLSVQTSLTPQPDGLFLGIIEGPQRESSAYETTSTKFYSGEKLGKRLGLYAPTSSKFFIHLTVFLIKNPTSFDQKLMESDLGKFRQGHPKIIFERTFRYDGSFNREAKETGTSDEGGVVNYTSTRKNLEQNMKSLAEQSARDIEELVINVF